MTVIRELVQRLIVSVVGGAAVLTVLALPDFVVHGRHIFYWDLLVAIIFILIVWEVHGLFADKALWHRLTEGGLFAIYAVMLSTLIALRHMEMGYQLCFQTLIMVWAFDGGSYLVGKGMSVLRPRLCKRWKWVGEKNLQIVPTISPGKSWEGLVAGLAAGMGSLILSAMYLNNRGLPSPLSLRLTEVVPILVILLLGFGGDVLESALKRWANKKDSSNLLPGHGGVLDRIDALAVISTAMLVAHSLGIL